MKTIFLIPGWHGNEYMKYYDSAIKIFEKRGYKVITIKLNRTRRVMTKCYEEFKSQFLNYKRSKDEEIYILGFSFGAFLSLIASTELEIDGQFLCSISPFFKEDLPGTKKSWLNYLGKNRVKDLETVSFEKLATKIDCKTIIFYGDQEGPEVEKRALEAGEKIKNNTLIKIIGAQHDIGQKEYIEALEKNITS